MLKMDRQQQIKDYLLEHKRVSVDSMSRMLQVTAATVRADFRELEEEGYLVRFHGGATLNVIDYQEDAINNALSSNAVDPDIRKQELGSIVSHLIDEKEWIFLGPGTTTYHIAKALSYRNNVHVLTNSLLVANAMGTNPSCNTILLGGRIHSEGLYTQPEDMHAALRGIYLSKAFFSVDGVDINSGYTLSDMNVLDLFKTIYRNCSETYMAIDSSKYGKRAFMKLDTLDFKHSVITNDDLPAAFSEYYEEHGIKVYTKSAINNNIL